MAASSPQDAVILGRYRVAADGFAGSFSQVVKVVEVRTGEVRALKVMPSGDTMLLDEYEVLSRLSHPSLPRVYEVSRFEAADSELLGVPIGTPCFVAEWIDGGRCDDQPWEPGPDRAAQLWGLCADIASALAAIHGVGLVHGDVAPQNVLYARPRDHDRDQHGGEPRAVLVDLGFVTRRKLESDSSSQRVEHSPDGPEGARGTPAYMAPEALTGHVEPRSDIYGLGATLARLVLGHAPFAGATLGELVHRILTQPPSRLVEVPPSFADLIRRMMARDARDRPASAVGVLDELDQLAPAIAPSQARRARPAVSPPRATSSWESTAPVVDAIVRALEQQAPVIEVVGIAATGSHLLVAAALQRWQLAEVAAGRSSRPVVDGTLDDVATALGMVPLHGPTPRDPRRWLEQLARAAGASTMVVVFDVRDDPRAHALVAALDRVDERAPSPGIIALTDRADADHHGSIRRVTIVAPTLDLAGVAAVARQMLGAEPPASWSQALLVASGGYPVTVVELVESIADERDPFSVDWTGRTTASATERRRRQLGAVSESARRIAMAVAVWGGRVRADRLLATVRDAPGVDLASIPAAGSLKSSPKPVRGKASLADVAELVRRGLARRAGDVIAIDRAVADAALESADPTDTAALALAGLSVASRGTVGPVIVKGFVRRADATHVPVGTQGLTRRVDTTDVVAETPTSETTSTSTASSRASIAAETTSTSIASSPVSIAAEMTSTSIASSPASTSIASAPASIAAEITSSTTSSPVSIAASTSIASSPASIAAEMTSSTTSSPVSIASSPSSTSVASSLASIAAETTSTSPASIAAGMTSSTTSSPITIAAGMTRTSTASSPVSIESVASLLEHTPIELVAWFACDIADQLIASGRSDRALPLARRVAATLPARGYLLAARAASALAIYRDVPALANAAETAGADPVETQLVIARAAQRAGDLDAAETTLAALHARSPEHAEVAGTYARLLVTRSRFAEARAVAIGAHASEYDAPSTDAHAGERDAPSTDAHVGERDAPSTDAHAGERDAPLPDAHAGERDAPSTDAHAGERDAPLPDAHAGERDAPLTGLRAEAAGLASLYLGDLDDADRAFAALELDAQTQADEAAIGRALSLRGMVAQQRGQLGLASDRYREAARRLHDVGEIHAAATAELNLGVVLSERGRASDALPRLAAAGRVFSQLGAITELVAADLDRGNALIAVGQLDDARQAADAALARADGAPHLRTFALLVAGEARRRAGDDSAAETYFRDALATAASQHDAHAQVSAWVCLADVGVAEVLDADVASLCASNDDRDRWTVAHGRLVLRLARPASTAAELAELARACAAAGARADAADRLDYAFRAHVVAAGLARRAGARALARSEAERARAAHAAIVAATAPAFRAAVEADPDLATVAEATIQEPRGDARDPDAPRLRRLLTLSRRLNTEASVERILDEVIDTAIELTAAERGFLLLRGAAGELSPVVSRNFHASDLAPVPHSASVSRSIAERAAQTGEPVVTVDAGVDERFGGAASVAALRLRSVLAVPLRQRGVVTGCIYVDHRLRGGAFDEQAATVLGELAEIAAIAIENARLSSDLRMTTRAVDELNAKLSDELADRDAELVRVKAELPDRDRLRGRYDHIVGRSLAIQRMLDVIDRAAVTALPVVVIGESGTGKELVARALHDAGPRKAGPFVAINCSAVPETLLESELFGHVRGAFTGADRDRRGLFEVAHGGTLFLDEIADTSPAMQAKLLRVLQDGVIRRVGDTATRAVDVRVITASRRSLGELAADGSFRDDLRYRLEVISVPVPPLRDRDGDLPLLVEHLLHRAATVGRLAKPARLTRAAMRALGQHRWPGNVRELENALARGVAMGGEVIDVDDLPEAVAAASGRPEPAKPAVQDDLHLKPALAATEHAYITAAMARAKNNQTVAARLLGLSRFGLQKKLRRLAGDTDDD